MWANRAFLRRAVTFLAEQDIDQFLDIGAGLPTAGPVHEIAREINPDARVVYVDSDAIAVIHGEMVLQDDPRASAIQADARQPEAILGHGEVRQMLDFDRPVAVLLVALLHFITDDAAAEGVMRALREALAPGSYLVLSHATSDEMPADARERMTRLYAHTSNPIVARSRARIARFFAGTDLVEPGLVYAPLWRPEGPDDVFLAQPARSVTVAGVGRKP